jgi:hypothetical protein
MKFGRRNITSFGRLLLIQTCNNLHPSHSPSIAKHSSSLISPLDALCTECLYYESRRVRLRMVHRCAEWDEDDTFPGSSQMANPIRRALLSSYCPPALLFESWLFRLPNSIYPLLHRLQDLVWCHQLCLNHCSTRLKGLKKRCWMSPWICAEGEAGSWEED